MKLTQLAVIATTLAFTGCSDIVSLHPFVAESEAVVDSRLNGVWFGSDDVYVIRQADKGYSITYSDKKGLKSYKLEALILKVGDALLFDLTPAEEDAFQVPAHTPMRVWVEGATLRIAFLDSKWLIAHATAELATQQVNGRTLITAPGEDVTRFLLAYGADTRAFGTPSVLRRQE
ncbi:MAG: hypothetical protein ABI806_07780 [Candidatus Solibacter sp.]